MYSVDLYGRRPQADRVEIGQRGELLGQALGGRVSPASAVQSVPWHGAYAPAASTR